MKIRYAIVHCLNLDGSELLYRNYRAEETGAFKSATFYCDIISRDEKSWEYLKILCLDWKSGDIVESFLCDEEKIFSALRNSGFKFPNNGMMRNINFFPKS